MTKLVLRNYLQSFTWQNIKKNPEIGSLLIMLFYLTFVYPLIDDVTFASVLESVLLFLPFTIVILTSYTFPMMLPKQLYISPLNNAMRREYLCKSSLVRICVPIFADILILAELMIFGKLNKLLALGSFLNLTIFAIFWGSGIRTNGNQYATLEKGKVKTFKSQKAPSYQFGGLEILCYFVCFLETFFLSVLTQTENPATFTWAYLLLIGITLLVSLPMTISYLKYWPNALENALSFETCYNKPTKSK